MGSSGILATMKIYTRGGDKGSTGLIGGARVPKDDVRLEAYGAVDELNALLGEARSRDETGEFDAALGEIQRDLFVVGSSLAAPDPDAAKLPDFDGGPAERLEAWIDSMEEELPPLRSFVLPGGAPLGAALHRCRTVCRRAERAVVALSHGAAVAAEILIYLNRLSDFLFVAARLANRRAGVEEEPWVP
jgi:cob(I)alamin adenosyltransferase